MPTAADDGHRDEGERHDRNDQKKGEDMPQIECRLTLVRTVDEVLALVLQLRYNNVRNLAHVLPFLCCALGLGGAQPTLGERYETTAADIIG